MSMHTPELDGDDSAHESDFVSPEEARKAIGCAVLTLDDIVEALSNLKQNAMLGEVTTGSVGEKAAFIALCDSLISRVRAEKDLTEKIVTQIVDLTYASNYKKHSWHTRNVFTLLARELTGLITQAQVEERMIELSLGSSSTFSAAVAFLGARDAVQLDEYLMLFALSDEEIACRAIADLEEDWQEWLADMELETGVLSPDQVGTYMFWRLGLQAELRGLLENKSELQKKPSSKNKKRRKK
jgi:hypothetical protein